MTASRTRKRLILALVGAGDVLPGDFVRCMGGKGVGLLESITGDHATVCDLARPGHREILPVAILTRAVAP